MVNFDLKAIRATPSDIFLSGREVVVRNGYQDKEKYHCVVSKCGDDEEMYKALNL